MLRSLKQMMKYSIHATDGELGGVNDFYFDDRDWVIRYMVVDTGNWLPGRKVLISPGAIDRVNWNERHIAVNLTKERVKGSPSVDTAKPVSRQMEEEVLRYYAWPLYWENYGGPKLPQSDVAPPHHSNGDPNLRSAAHVNGHHLKASDGEIGHLDDFVADDESWTIRYLVADTGNWIPGKKVLIAPIWVSSFDWANSLVHVDLSREAIKASPEFDPSRLDRAYETLLHEHYNRPTYWK